MNFYDLWRRRRKLVFLFVLGLVSFVGCSTTNRYLRYRADQPEGDKPKISQELTGVNLIFKTAPRSLFQKDFQQRAYLSIPNFGRTVYSVGPLFLPIIPAVPRSFWGGEIVLDESQEVEIVLSAESDPIFNEKIVELPDLLIQLADGRILKARSASDGHRLDKSKHFIFKAVVRETPWFILKAATIKLDNGKALAIPEMKFVLTSEFVINWNEPIAP